MTAVARRRWIRACLAPLAFAVLGCQTAAYVDRVTRWDEVARPAKPADAPIVVALRAGLARPFKAIGSVEVTTPRWQKEAAEEVVLEAMKTRARAIGGDAIIDVKRTPSGRRGWAGPGMPPAGTTESYDETWSGVVIVFTGEPASGPAQPR